MKQQENKAVIVWRGAANTGLVSSADRAYMKAPSLVLRRTYGYTPVKIEMGAVALTCGSSFYISNTKRRASKSPAFVV